MGIRRHTASKDATITNAFKPDNRTRATASNTGKADSLEVFHKFTTGSIPGIGSDREEDSRILIEFDISRILNDKKSDTADYYLRLENVKHHETLPENYDLSVKPINKDWKEGFGVDLDNYSDPGYTSGASGEFGVTWDYAKSGSQWNTGGGDFHSSPAFSDHFPNGPEDMRVEITSLVDEWISGSKSNHGVGIKLTSSQETGSQSYYTKKFSARGTEFFHSKPVIEERWDSHVEDDRHDFFPSSSVAPSGTNLNKIHFYNRNRGQLNKIPGDPEVYVKVYRNSDYTNEVTGSAISPNNPITASLDYAGKGRYDAELALDSTASVLYDEWYSGSDVLHQDSISLNQTGSENLARRDNEFIVSIPNLRKEYRRDDNPRLRVTTRKKDTNPTVYTSNKGCPQLDIVKDMYYKISRTLDNHEVISYGTGAVDHTRLSYDASGSYFDMNTKLLQSDMGYKIEFARNIDGRLNEFDEEFEFRVE